MSNGTYAVYRFGYFSDLVNRQYRVDLTRRGWNFPDAAVEVPIEQDSVEIEYGASDPFEPVNPSQLKVTFLADDVGVFRPIFTADDELFRLSVYEITSGSDVLIWAGYVMPDEYSEAYKEPPARVDITAIDGLGVLKQKKLNSYTGYKTVIEIITECLFKLQESGQNDTEIFNGSIFENLKSRPSHLDFTQPLLGNIYHSKQNYTEKTPDEPEAEDFNCLSIIKEALKPYGAVLQKWEGGTFVIFEPQARAQTSDWFQYVNGAYTGNTNSIDTNHSLDFTGGSYDKSSQHFPVLRDQKLNIDKAVKAINIDFEATKTRARSLIEDGGFKHYDNSAQTLKYWSINNNSQEGLNFEVRTKPELTTYDIFPNGLLGNSKHLANPLLRPAEPIDARRNIIVFKTDEIAFNQPLRESTPNDYIKSTPVPAPKESFEFSVKWKFPSPNVLGKNFSIKEFAPLNLEIILEGSSGTDYWLQFDSSNEEYVFSTSNNQLEFKTADDKEQEKTIKFDTPEAGQIRLSLFGYGEHVGESNVYSAINYRSGELAIYGLKLKVAEVASLKFSKTRKVNKGITYSTDDVDVGVIHWDNGQTPGSSGDVTRDEGGLSNTKGWEREGLAQEGVSLLQNLANLYLDTFSRPLRLLSGSFNMPSITRLLIDNFSLTEGNKVYTLYPVGGTLNFCTGFGNLKLKEVGEPSTNFFDPSTPPEFDVPIYDPEVGGPVNDEGPGLPNLTGGEPVGEFQTPHLSSQATRVRYNSFVEGPEPDDPPAGTSVEWLDDGSYDQPGVKWQKIISPEGQKIISKLSGLYG
jgi:hypothetical protein